MPRERKHIPEKCETPEKINLHQEVNSGNSGTIMEGTQVVADRDVNKSNCDDLAGVYFG